MGRNKTVQEPRIDDAINHAEACFWMAVCETYPEIKADDSMPIPLTMREQFIKAMRLAIQAWLRENVVRNNKTATCDLRVEMRPPKKGERGWMVEALTAEDALAEILRESEELGWVADKDYDAAFDEYGMHAVTIVIEKSKSHPFRMLTQNELERAQGVKPSDQVRVDLPLTQPVPLLADKIAPIVKTPIPGPDDPERIHEDDVWGEFVEKLPLYNGWSATWMYPGYIAWHHPERPMFVCATPDFHQPGSIAVDVQDNHGRVFHQAGDIQDLFWPVGANRTPETYLGVIGPVLDKVFVMPYHEEAENPDDLCESQKADAQRVVFKALEISRLMNEICELSSDHDINQLLTEAYPFKGSLDEVACEVIAWRDAMAKKADVKLCPEGV